MKSTTDNAAAVLSALEAQGGVEAQGVYLASHPEMVVRSSLHTLADAIRTAFRSDIPRALRLADMSLLIARKLDDSNELALALRAKANALSLLGRSREALEMFEQSAQLFADDGQLEEVGRTRSTSIRSFLLLGDYDGAFAAAAEARRIFEDRGEWLRIARLEINVANIYHRQNRFVEALDGYHRAYEQLLPHADIEGVAVALHNVGVCRIALDDFRGALETYQQLRAICESQQMPLLVAQADYNSAYLYFLRGDFTQSLNLLQSSREIYKRNNDDYHLGLCDLDQAEIFIELGLSEEAVEMAQSSYECFSRLGTRYEMGRALAYRGIAHAQRSEYAKALSAFESSQRIFAKEHNRAWPSLLDLYCASARFQEGDWDEAERLSEPTLNVFRDVGMPGKELQAVLLLGRIALLRKSFDRAQDFSRRALEIVRELELPALGFQAWLLEGEIQEACGSPYAARTAYGRCRETLETLRGGLHADELKIGLMKERVRVYERLVALDLERVSTDFGAAEEAFLYIEEARSRSLRDLVFRTASDTNTGETSLDDHVANLRRDLNWYYHRIEKELLSEEGLNLEQIRSLREQARVRERELLRLERVEIVPHKLAGSPGQANQQVGETSLLGASRAASLDEVLSSLRPGTILIEYYATGDRLLAAVLCSNRLRLIPLAPLPVVQKSLRALDFQLKKFRLGASYRNRFDHQLLQSVRVHLQELYRELVAPLSSYMEGEHLVIVPWGLLHELPFHALLDEQQYLIEQFSISYAPSASIYSLSQPSSGSAADNALVIAVDSATTPHVRAEALAVADAVQRAQLLIGPDATEANLRAKGPHCRLIHIATHGYFRQDNPMFSSIRLAGSYLSLYDLYHMKLPVDLLTLSGCVTGTNAVTGGDELIGLTRGLFFAGAQSLLLSHWDVDDKSTAELMSSFYQRLRSEPRKAVALQSAMRDMLSTNPHPYFWAPFKLTSTAQSEFTKT